LIHIEEERMYARVSEVTGEPDKMDLGIAQFNDVVLPGIKQMDGFVRAYLLVDRAAGKALSISVWDSAEALAASEAAAAGMRADVTATVSGQGSATGYEVVVEG
jgi:heme-degrading monooxygenase HmoA